MHDTDTAVYKSSSGTSLHDLENEAPLMAVSKACALLNVSTAHFYNMIRDGVCPVRTVRIGKTHRVYTIDLLRILNPDAG